MTNHEKRIGAIADAVKKSLLVQTGKERPWGFSVSDLVKDITEADPLTHEVTELRAEVDRLREYEWMYKGLEK